MCGKVKSRKSWPTVKRERRRRREGGVSHHITRVGREVIQPFLQV